MVVRNEGGEDFGVVDSRGIVKFVREKRELGRADCEICY